MIISLYQLLCDQSFYFDTSLVFAVLLLLLLLPLPILL